MPLAVILTVLNIVYVLLLYAVQKLPLLKNRRPGGVAHCMTGLPNSYEAAATLYKLLKKTPIKIIGARHSKI
jgi:hypothetical protein